MKNIKAIGFCSLTALSTLFAGTVLAQDSYFYGGVGVGQSRAMVDDEAMSMKLRASGTMSNTIKADESDTTFKGFIGYQMNRNFGVEAGYFNLGKSSFTATTQPNGSYSSEQKIDGVNLDLVGTLPFTDKWSGLARVGAQYANVRSTAHSTGAVMLPSVSSSEKGFNIRYGLGVQYEVNRSLFVRAEADLNRVKRTDASWGNYCNYSVSLVIPFGRAAAPVTAAPVYVPPPAPALAPAYVAPAPAPAPAVVVAPPPPPVVAPAPVPVEVAPKRVAKPDRN